MKCYYLDPSAWLKRYFQEAGSDRVTALFSGDVRLACSRFGLTEVIAAISRRAGMEAVDRAIIERHFLLARRDFSLFDEITLDNAILDLAERLAMHHRLRGADAVHLASALALKPELDEQDELIMVSSDRELLSAASAEQLAVVNPVVAT